MTWWQALLLGVVQGLTEFLPISSSAHLVLVGHLLGSSADPAQAFIFDVLVQWGTLLAVLLYFWADWWAMLRAAGRVLARPGRLATDAEARLLLAVLLATVPAALVGVLLKDTIARFFSAPRLAGRFLVLTALGMAMAEIWGRRKRALRDLNLTDALWIGLGQALALLPGVSRSGATIAAGMARHLRRPAAARFSFLMAVPVMVGAGVLALRDLHALPPDPAFRRALVLGFGAAAVTGYAAIRLLLGYLSRHSLWPFIVYCLLLGVGVGWLW